MLSVDWVQKSLTKAENDFQALRDASKNGLTDEQKRQWITSCAMIDALNTDLVIRLGLDFSGDEDSDSDSDSDSEDEE